MIRSSLPFAAAAGVLLLGAADAGAQGFFERLFGIAPRQAPAEAPLEPAAPSAPSEEAPKRSAPAPVQARPTALRIPAEDNVLGRDLKLNGTSGSLRIDRTGRGDLRAQMVLAGRRSSQSPQTCTVDLGGPDGATLVNAGRPEGVSRFLLQNPGCPLQLDVLDESVLVKATGESCTVSGATCQVDPSGLWGPDPSQLIGRARDYETARATADKAVRDNYKVMVQRARPEGVRTIVSEQAGFSSDRETVCRNYAREGVHSFCNARVSEARAIALANRLGVTVTASAAPAADARPRRRRPANDPYGLPSTEELVQQPTDD